MDEADLTRKTGRILCSDFPRSIGAAIVYEDIFPILVRLAQNAFDALREVDSGVIEWRYDAY